MDSAWRETDHVAATSEFLGILTRDDALGFHCCRFLNQLRRRSWFIAEPRQVHRGWKCFPDCWFETAINPRAVFCCHRQRTRIGRNYKDKCCRVVVTYDPSRATRVPRLWHRVCLMSVQIESILQQIHSHVISRCEEIAACRCSCRNLSLWTPTTKNAVHRRRTRTGNGLSDWSWRNKERERERERERGDERKERRERRTDLTSSSFLYFYRWNSRLTALLVRRLKRDYTCRISARAKPVWQHIIVGANVRVTGMLWPREERENRWRRSVRVENYLTANSCRVILIKSPGWISCDQRSASGELVNSCMMYSAAFLSLSLSPLFPSFRRSTVFLTQIPFCPVIMQSTSAFDICRAFPIESSGQSSASLTLGIRNAPLLYPRQIKNAKSSCVSRSRTHRARFPPIWLLGECKCSRYPGILRAGCSLTN